MMPRVEPGDEVKEDGHPRRGPRLGDGAVGEAVLVVPQDAEVLVHFGVCQFVMLVSRLGTCRSQSESDASYVNTG